MTSMTPDDHAELATHCAQNGYPLCAFDWSVQSIRARADWVLVNAKWVPRRGILRA